MTPLTTSPIGACGHLVYRDGRMVATIWSGLIGPRYWRLETEGHEVAHSAPTLASALAAIADALDCPGKGETRRLL